MRPITSFVLHTLAAACVAALAASSAAAAGYMKFGDIKGQVVGQNDRKNEIEILSYSFGNSQARVAKVDGFAVKQKAVPYKLKPVFVKSWSMGGDAAPPPRGAGANQIAMDDTAGKEENAVGGARTETIGAARSRDVASGQATGKRQHKPLRTRMEYDGDSVTVGGRLAACSVGAAYKDAVIEAGGERFELQDVVVANCAANATTLNFAKVIVRGWDPKKKEE